MKEVRANAKIYGESTKIGILKTEKAVVSAKLR